MTNKTGLVALIVLAAATLLMVFFVLPNMKGDDKPSETPVATTSETPAEGGGETTTAGGKQARAPAEETPAEADTPASGEAAATAAQETARAEATPADPSSAWVTPAFDLLRVEPDGSTVIAGRGQPNTKLEIKNGETVVATADIGPSGDFAAVFDQPLPAGDYQLTLSTKDDKGGSKTSEEVATVSVPRDAGGELLAMVSRPGEASRLITVPEAAATAGDTAGAAEEETASAVAQDAGEETPAAATAETAEAKTEAGAAAEARVSAVELEGKRMFIAGTARPGALVRIYANDRLVGEAKADDTGHYVVDGVIDLPVGRHTVRADVMSADGGKVDFRASVPFDRPEGDQVSVIAQDNATAEAGPALGLIGGGAFDRLRADADKAVALLKGLYAGGRTPGAEELAAARSATEIALKSLAEFKPGEEEGEAARAMAAKASAAAASALARLQALPADAGAVGEGLGSIETAVADALASPMGKAEAAADDAATAAGTSIEALAERAGALQQQFTALFSEGRNASPADIQTARTALESALAGLAGSAAPAGAASDAVAAIERLKGWASTALDRLAAVPAGADGQAYRQALVALEGMPSLAASAGSAASATAGGEVAGQTPQTVEQAPLQESKTSVIIRRGDTLWQISRRIYGKGVRYTTIYLANEDQITNPDRINPGQVFGVPDKASESDADAEQQHRKRLRGN